MPLAGLADHGMDRSPDRCSTRLPARSGSVVVCFAVLALLGVPPATARNDQGFVCAGPVLGPAAKTTQSFPGTRAAEGRINVLVLFAKFAGDRPQQTTAPDWAAGLFDVDRPGSVSHFYQTMSGGRFTVDGVAAPRYYEAPRAATAYVAKTAYERGGYREFSHEILALADADVDFGNFNNDGPDGLPNSADDDAYVDIVFIILRDVPERFLAGPATGIFGLGSYPKYDTADDEGNRSLLVPPERISVLQGASFSEAAGILSHEFAHLLGVPDLYNVEFVYRGDGRPTTDSAGIGAWGLMAWGALGWSGTDGPNSFSAWTLLRLGWVEAVRPTRRDQVMRLGPILQSRQVFAVPMPNRERFLIANRQREGNHYDRHSPGEGLMIWHEDPAGDGVLDLECADGRWLEAGFPEGKTQHAVRGGDNLDFWAHDADYAAAHNGNVGDGTDPFDGVRYRSFTTDTNPESYSNTREWSFRLDDIAFETDGTATARIQPVPLVEVEVDVLDHSGDGILLAGEEAELAFRLSVDERYGRELKAVFASDDELVVMERPGIEFTTSLLGGSHFKSYDTSWHGHPQGLPMFRLSTDIEGVRDVPLCMSIFRAVDAVEQWELLWQEDFTVEVISARRPDLTRVSLVEVEGDGDGRAQAGEVISLAVELGTRPEILGALIVRARALDEDVRRLSTPRLTFDAVGQQRARSSHSPEFLLPADWRPETDLQFEIVFTTGYDDWADTVAVPVATGPDETPPRVGDAFLAQTPQGMSFVLLESRILDASPTATATALVFALPDSDRVAAIPLERHDGHFAGLWETDDVGSFTASVIVDDEAGNAGLSQAAPVTLRRHRVGPFPQGVVQVPVAGPVVDLAFGINGSAVAAAIGTRVELYDPFTLRRLTVLPVDRRVTAVAIDQGDRFVAAGGEDGTVTLWDLHSWRQLGQIGADGFVAGAEAEPGSAVSALAFGTTPPLLAVGHEDGSIDLWAVESSRPRYRETLATTDTTSITALAFQPGEDRLAAGKESGRILLRRVDRGIEQTLSAHEGAVRSVAFSDEGARFASAGRDETVKLWVDRGIHFTLSRVHEDHDDAVEAVAFSRGSQILASAGLDGRVVLRRPEDGVRPLVAVEAGGLTSLAFSPDGAQLVSGSWNGALQFSQVSSIEIRRRPLEAQPQDAVLLWAYPNPFNAGTVLPFRLLRRSAVSIEIYNIGGQVVRVLDVGERAAGMYAVPPDAVQWDGRNQDGVTVAAGVYIAVLKAGNTTLRQKLLLLK